MADTSHGGWMDGRPARPARVVIVGGGFGGLRAARALRNAPVLVTLVDRRNHHLFQPLLYQVATGSLSPGEIATPLRAILKRQRNLRVVLAEVESVDLGRRVVEVSQMAGDGESAEIGYETLIVAAGAAHSYFGHDEWGEVAPGLKTLEDALEIRRRILLAFEAAEIEPDTARRCAWLTFVVVGAGPTGVEMAGQIAEIARDTLRRDFRTIDPRGTRVLLVEAADRVLGGFHQRLSGKAAKALSELGVDVRLGAMVTGIDGESVTVTAGEGEQRIQARTVVWAAGVAASPLAASLAEASGAEVDRSGRISVDPDLTLPGHPEVFAIGDMVRLADPAAAGRPLPGVAQVAMQQGEHAAATIARRLAGDRRPRPFRYLDKGNMATIGRVRAVAELMHGRVRLSGLPAWLMWLFVHLLYLIGFQNRLIVFIRWSFSFLTRGRGARLITGSKERTALPATRGAGPPS